MNRLPIPSNIHDLATRAHNDAKRAATALTGTSTLAALTSARLAVDRSIDAQRALKPMIRRLEREARLAGSVG